MYDVLREEPEREQRVTSPTRPREFANEVLRFPPFAVRVSSRWRIGITLGNAENGMRSDVS